MSLSQYIEVRKHVCKTNHANCKVCPPMIHVADTVNKYGYWKMKSAYMCSMEHVQPCLICPEHIYSPQGQPLLFNAPSARNYTTAHAKRKFLRMPLVCVAVPVGPKESANFLIAKGSNYSFMTSIIKQTNEKKPPERTLSKECVSNLIKSCNSDPERERLRYAITETSNLSRCEIKRQFGFQDISNRKEKVEAALKKQMEIRESVYRLASIKEKAVLLSFGVDVQSDSSEGSSSDSESDTERCSDNEQEHVFADSDSESFQKRARIASEHQLKENVARSSFVQEQQVLDYETRNETETGNGHPGQLQSEFRDRYELPLSKQQTSHGLLSVNTNQLLDLLKAWKLNWMAFVESLQNEIPQITQEALDQLLLDFARQLPYLGLLEKEEEIIEQSRQIYLEKRRVEEMNKEMEDMIVSESDESDVDPGEWVKINDVLGPEAQQLISRKVNSLRKQAARTAAKKIESERFLRRKRSTHVGTILKKYPTIGKEIEDFVKSRGVGAEAWRRTGVLTFDGNRKVQQKVTFSRIKEHLEEKYDRKFSYGTVVQMCVARNRRRKAAANYKGVAQVTCRRARKGFEIKYNPDCHWSNAFYKGLDFVQYKDGRDKLLLNRDDLSVFRLDSMCTSNKAPTHCLKGAPSLTTKTDYQEKYPNKLQTTSYNFTASDTTGEICVGVVKSSAITPKGPSQHLADLTNLEDKDEIKHVFQNATTEEPKEIECIRVDSGGDEALYHEEVQFWWTLRHLERPTRMQLVTSRYSGGSSLNRVELQNGCETKARAGLFIPSTLNGSNYQTGSGQIDQSKLQQNLFDAIDVYISRVSGASCGYTTIRLFHGEGSARNHELKKHYTVFSKGTEEEKEKLKQEHPDIHELIRNVLDVKKRHMNTTGIPLRYVFQLICCYERSCPHPLCKKGKPDKEKVWFEGGPPISFIPLPVKDDERPFGWADCPKCPAGKCTGHFVDSSKVVNELRLDQSTYKPMSVPPTEVIKEAFNKFGNHPDDSEITNLAREVLLPVHEVQMWLDHLEAVRQHRKAGAKKAAETRRKKNAEKGKNKGQGKTSRRGKGKQKRPHKTTVQESDSETEICSTCKECDPPSDLADTLWVQCDGCLDWHHQLCVGVTDEADLAVWHCEECLQY